MAKPAVLREVIRVLEPGAELHVMDFGRPARLLRWVVFSLLRLFDGLDNTSDNARGLLASRLEEAGFEDVGELASTETLVGTVIYLKARRPQEASRRGGRDGRTPHCRRARDQTRSREARRSES